jgi:hypothetical protein
MVCMVDNHFMGDTQMFDIESKNSENSQTLGVFVPLVIVLSFACALCSMTTFYLNTTIASYIFVILIVGILFDIFAFRNLAILAYTGVVYRNGKKSGY